MLPPALADRCELDAASPAVAVSATTSTAATIATTRRFDPVIASLLLDTRSSAGPSCRRNRCQSAVDREDAAGHVGGVVGTQIDGELAHLRRRAQPVHGDDVEIVLLVERAAGDVVVPHRRAEHA